MEGKEQVHLQSCFIIGLQVLTRDALAAGLAACSTYANMFPPASTLRSMPSSLPNGSASVEPTPRWPVVGTLMGGRANPRQPFFPTTHRALPTTHNTQHTTTHNPQDTTRNTQWITHNTQHTTQNTQHTTNPIPFTQLNLPYSTHSTQLTSLSFFYHIFASLFFLFCFLLSCLLLLLLLDPINFNPLFFH